MDNGWVKLHRDLLDKSIWKLSTPEQRNILITLLLLANHKENKWEFNGRQYTCLPGQFITSLSSLAYKCGNGVTIQNIRTALKRFENLEFLTKQSTKTETLITIVNWGFYQGLEDEPNTETNKGLTQSQHRANTQLTTNKNEKNVKNVRNNIFKPPTVEEVRSYCEERKNKVDPETFVNFYESKGWKVGKNPMKNWKAAVRTWERNKDNKQDNEVKQHGEEYHSVKLWE